MDISGDTIVKESEIPFYKHQQQELMHDGRLIDPRKIEDYIARDGYSALAKTLSEMKGDEVIDLVTKSGLRGRGGGGFPAGIKWATCAKHHGTRYVICNADEGDPGAYMDRSILEGNPHAVIEGMIIGAFTIGSDEGYVYVRHEYPLAVERLGIALQQAREQGDRLIVAVNVDETVRKLKGEDRPVNPLAKVVAWSVDSDDLSVTATAMVILTIWPF